MSRQQCCIGVMAYNEEANIGQLLDALTHQDVRCCHLREIVVVASGCTDRTVEIAQGWATRDSRITVLAQETREGKASAVNEFIVYAQSIHADLLILESADTLPADERTMERLLSPFFEDPELGMTGTGCASVIPSIAAGHAHLHATQRYVVSTLNPCRIFKMLWYELIWTPKALLWTVGAIILEAYGRFLGLFDFYVKRKNPFKWDMAETTKTLEHEG